MSVLGLIYGLLTVTQLLFAVLGLGFARLVGAQVREVWIGSPAVLSFAVRRVLLKIGPIPGATLDIAELEQQPLAKRLVIRLGPWVVQLAIAMALIGPVHALRSFGRAFYQLLFVWNPRDLAERFVSLVEHGPLATVLGVLLAKVVAFNLLPFSMLSGGGVIEDVAYRSRNKPVPPAWMVFSLVIVLVIAGRWAWALLAAARVSGD